MHDYLYWDYGHARERFAQAVRKGKWKAVRNGSHNPVELYDLSAGPSEAANLTAEHPAIAKEMAAPMDTAYVPSPDFPIADRK